MGDRLKQLWEKQVVRFLFFGVITAAFNVVLITLMIELLKEFNLNTPLLRNVANVVAVEISLLVSFVVYRLWVWSSACNKLRSIFLEQIPLYHVSASLAFASRSFIIFPILDWLKVHYAVNTLIGIAIGSVLNYKFSDRIVFRKKRSS